MATVKWTTDQLNAIKLTPKKMLVSAAAGSGKTAVLSERILRRLTDPNSNTDITKFLVVTYTRLAAAELRSRIGKKLREEAVNTTGAVSRRLSRQCNLLGSAYISTIHSYCAALVKRHFRDPKLDLPPVLKVCEESPALEIKERIMDDLIELAYRGDFEPIPDFEAFANNFVTANDKKLAEKMLKLYQTVSGLPNGFRRWRESADLLASTTPFLQTPWGELLITDYCRTLKYYQLGYEAILEAVKHDPKCEKFCNHIANELQLFTELSKALQSNDVTGISAALANIDFKSLPKTTSAATADDRTEFNKKVRTKAKEFILELKASSIFRIDTENGSAESAELRYMREKSAGLSKALIAFLNEFNNRYKEEKRRLGILDFADLEQYTYMLLYNDDGSLTPLSHQVSASFDEIFVDEFQDINPMQSKIFEALSCECAIFQVGDIKQSIYGFRGAAPNIFADCRRSYTALDPNDPTTQNADELTVFLSATSQVTSIHSERTSVRFLFSTSTISNQSKSSRMQQLPQSTDQERPTVSSSLQPNPAARASQRLR